MGRRRWITSRQVVFGANRRPPSVGDGRHNRSAWHAGCERNAPTALGWSADTWRISVGSDVPGSRLALRMELVVDRITPTYRPLGWPIGRQSWRRLLVLRWPVSVDSLGSVVPAGLSIDTWEGTALVIVVAFEVREARAAGVPGGLGLGFLETNVRTHVHVDGRDPGIYFFSLDATSALAERPLLAQYASQVDVVA